MECAFIRRRSHNGAVPNREIHAVFLAASGGVWLKTRAAGLLFWKDGRLTIFADRRCTPVLQMEAVPFIHPRVNRSRTSYREPLGPGTLS